VAELVACLEGNLPPILCSVPEQRSETCRSEEGNCASSKLCCELEASVMSVLANTTLANITNASFNPNPGGDVDASEHSGEEHALPIANTQR
jgi:DNA-binding IscR family transcriptional regulator